MSIHEEEHIHGFLKNKEMNEMYLSTFLMVFAQGLISVFVPVYLYFLGYSIESIIFYSFLIALFFIIFTPFSVKIISKIGAKHSMSLSIPFLIIYFSGLNILQSTPILFYILPMILAIRLSLYNTSYHLNYIEHSDAKKSSKEISILTSLPLLASLLSPLLGGLIIFYLGYNYIYTAGAMILAISIIPLLITEDKKEKIKFKTSDLFLEIFKKKNIAQNISFSGYASASSIGIIIWPLFLTTLAISTKSLGFIISISGAVTLLVIYIIGKKNIAKNNEEKAIKNRTILHTLGWIARLFTDSVFSAFLVDSYKKIAFRLLYIPWSVYTYDVAKKQDYFQFIVSREMVFNLSRVIFLPILILIFHYDFYPFTLSFLLAAILSSSYPLLTKKKI